MSKLGQMLAAVAKKQTYNAPMRVLSYKEIVTASCTQRKNVKASNHEYRQILTFTQSVWNKALNDTQMCVEKEANPHASR